MLYVYFQDKSGFFFLLRGATLHYELQLFNAFVLKGRKFHVSFQDKPTLIQELTHELKTITAFQRFMPCISSSLLESEMQVSFQHVSRSANGMTNYLAKRGVDWSCNLSAPVV